MIGPEQSKKAPGKSGKKKAKAKKVKRQVIVDAAGGTEPSTPELQPTVEPSVLSEAGPQLLVWIDRVQERVDHLLTLVDPAPAPSTVDQNATAAPDPAPAPARSTVDQNATTTPDPAPAPSTVDQEGTTTPDVAPASAFGTGPTNGPSDDVDGYGASLAEAWARRQQEQNRLSPDEAAEDRDTDDRDLEDRDTEDRDVEDSDELFEPVDARLTAVLVARELIAQGVRPADVRRRLREGYGVIDPDAVLAHVAA